MKRKQMLPFIAILILMGLGSSCTSYKQIPYLQSKHSFEQEATAVIPYEARILPNDLLTIIVSCSEPESATPFNLSVPTSQSKITSLTTQPVLQAYLVDNAGEVDFPVLGTIHLGGLTKREAEKFLQEKLKSYINETPIVNVRMINYKVSVMGEVSRPSTFVIDNEKVNIFEALALAGDLTIYGKRENVKLIRETALGKKEIITLNLNDADILHSPYYYLQQNDIVYVEPNKAKAKNSDIGNSTSLWFSATSILVSIISLAVNLLR